MVKFLFSLCFRSVLTYILNCQFNKAPGKVVEEFKLRVVYIPANPPSPVPEESEEGSSQNPSTFENGAQNLPLFDSVSSCYLLTLLNMSLIFFSPFIFCTKSLYVYLASFSSSKLHA